MAAVPAPLCAVPVQHPSVSGLIRLAEGVDALVAPETNAAAQAIAAAQPGAVVLACECRDYAGETRSGSIASLTIAPAALLRGKPAPVGTRSIVFIVSRAWAAGATDSDAPAGAQRCATTFYLPEELNAVATGALEDRFTGFAAEMYRAAKCQELLCEVVELWRAGKLVARTAGGAYGLADAERLMQARQMIATRYAEKLTLEAIARACGLNRAKLTQGFRELFNQSVAEALAEQRLLWAARELRTSGKPVASVGYSAGYLNNASFARAFSKRFGQCPTDYRRAPAALASVAP